MRSEGSFGDFYWTSWPAAKQQHHYFVTAPKPEHGVLVDGRDVYYLNIEGRLKKRDLEGIPGLNLDKFHVIGSQQVRYYTEEYLSIGKRILTKNRDLQSLTWYSALCTEAEITADMGKNAKIDGAKLGQVSEK